MGQSVFPAPSATTTLYGWTAGTSGTYALSATLDTGVYRMEVDSTQTMDIGLTSSEGYAYTGTVRGGTGWISVSSAVNQVVIPTGKTYPFLVTFTKVTSPQLSAPTISSLTWNNTTLTGAWSTAPATATAVRVFVNGYSADFSSTSTGATVVIPSNFIDKGQSGGQQVVVAWRNASGVYGIGNKLYTGATPSSTTSVDYLVVAGGGGGGESLNNTVSGCGGGGGGGYRTATGFSVTPGAALTLTVGAGGAQNTKGSDSVFSSITSTGGGYGGGASVTAGGSGGSGGGAEAPSGAAVGAGNTPSTSPSQGNNGGSANNGGRVGGGGGGAGGAASNQTAGAGASSSISGTARFYSGGGGGSSAAYAAGTPGAGGSGVGGAGVGGFTAGNAGTANRGGGGSGAGGGDGSTNPQRNGGPGGSGVVIISYPTSFLAPAVTGGLTYSTATNGSNTVYTFTAGTGTVTF